jgi:HlyD family secretion protein
VEAAEAEALRWREEYDRQLLLLDNGVGTARDLEVARSAHETARARLLQARENAKLVTEGPREEAVRRARAALAEADARHALVVEGPRPEAIDQARAVLQRARESQVLAEVQLSYATVASPLTGVVLSENVEPGEVVAAGTPVVTVGDLADVWLRAYVSETDLGRVHLGQQVDITTDTYPGKIYTGRLSFLSSSAEFTPKSVQTQQERVKLVYRVKVTVANPDGELKPGMPADGVIRSGP